MPRSRRRNGGRMQSRSKSLRLHARKRARERYGFELGRDTERRLIECIHAGDYVVVERQSHRVSVHDVVLPDLGTVRVVYDRERQQLVTLLPRP